MSKRKLNEEEIKSATVFVKKYMNAVWDKKVEYMFLCGAGYKKSKSERDKIEMAKK